MPNKCVVPGCCSNYKKSKHDEGYVRLFTFPLNGTRRDEWVRAICRSDWAPTKNSYVCVKHFLPDDLIWVETYKDKNGKVCRHTRAKPMLRGDAIPRLFPDFHRKCTKRKAFKMEDTQERRQKDERRSEKLEGRLILEREDKVEDLLFCFSTISL